MGFPRQEYWSRLPFPPVGDLPDTGMEKYLQSIYIRLRVDIQNICRTHTINSNKTNNLTKKWTENMNRCFFPEEIHKWPTVCTGCTSEGNDVVILKIYLYPHVSCSTIPSSQDTETTSADEWMKKMWLYIQWNIIQT